MFFEVLVPSCPQSFTSRKRWKLFCVACRPGVEAPVHCHVFPPKRLSNGIRWGKYIPISNLAIFSVDASHFFFGGELVILPFATHFATPGVC